MKQLPLYILFMASVFFLSVLSGCRKDTDEIELDFGYEYYPLEIGKSWIYQVDSVIYGVDVRGITRDSSRSFLREAIVDTTTSLDGELLYITERYYRPNDEAPWKIDKVFTRSRNRTQAFQTEDNLRFIKMVFPPTPGKRWDGHVYFDAQQKFFPVGGEQVRVFQDWDYVVTDKGQPAEVNGAQYDDVAAIQEADYDVDLNYRRSQALYARDIGLVYRQSFIYDTNCIACCNSASEVNEQCRNTPWEEKAEKGYELRQTLIGYN